MSACICKIRTGTASAPWLDTDARSSARIAEGDLIQPFCRQLLHDGDTGAAVLQILSEHEKRWVDEYHAEVWQKVSPRLEGQQGPLEWLRAHTRPLPATAHLASQPVAA